MGENFFLSRENLICQDHGEYLSHVKVKVVKKSP
jgi:hypothetical protein